MHDVVTSTTLATAPKSETIKTCSKNFIPFQSKGSVTVKLD